MLAATLAVTGLNSKALENPPINNSLRMHCCAAAASSFFAKKITNSSYIFRAENFKAINVSNRARGSELEFPEMRNGVNAAASGNGVKQYPPVETGWGIKRGELFLLSRSRISIAIMLAVAGSFALGSGSVRANGGNGATVLGVGLGGTGGTDGSPSSATGQDGAAGGAPATTGPVAYRPAVVGYSVTPLLNADYGFSILDRPQERVGDVASVDSAEPAHGNGV
ncbi:hypothetical protein [Paraburkholderia sp. J8-2]|uniref:hypothetical protein n=1 Tax=Paraburkholderia sp. J8-2 TaxID=2805440 RepID=UPI0039EEA192